MKINNKISKPKRGNLYSQHPISTYNNKSNIPVGSEKKGPFLPNGKAGPYRNNKAKGQTLVKLVPNFSTFKYQKPPKLRVRNLIKVIKIPFHQPKTLFIKNWHSQNHFANNQINL